MAEEESKADFTIRDMTGHWSAPDKCWQLKRHGQVLAQAERKSVIITISKRF